MGARREPTSRAVARRPIAEVQRTRLVKAAVAALADGGYPTLTVAAVIGRARVSRKTFYEVFSNRDECFEAVFEFISARAVSVVSAACSTEGGWIAETRASLEGLLSLIEEDPGLAKIWLIESLKGPPAVLDRWTRAMSRMADAIHLGGNVADERARPSHLVAEATVGGVSHIIRTRLVAGSEESFQDLTGPLMYLIALPYLGQRSAQAELRRASARALQQRARVQRSSAGESSPDDLRIRLTYRTISALGAIADRPGASNVEVSAGCGIKDQGQISKLLSRLERVGLTENRGSDRSLGVPNAWYITTRGAELVRATRGLEAPADPRSGSTRRGVVGL